MTDKKIKVNVTTSIELQVWKLAKKKKISWNKALTEGIKSLAKKIPNKVKNA
jgi:hypothetical protein|tara:strand:- start:4799 stop:4954 length:156 start_codon:yes stop_codon:yes gene_type:complete